MLVTYQAAGIDFNKRSCCLGVEAQWDPPPGGPAAKLLHGSQPDGFGCSAQSFLQKQQEQRGDPSLQRCRRGRDSARRQRLRRDPETADRYKFALRCLM